MLHSLSFDVPARQVTLLAGRNGAGKTTWVRVALGLARATSGDVRFDGRPIEDVRDRVGVVLDEPPVFAGLSGLQNLRQLSGRVSFGEPVFEEIRTTLGLDDHFLRMRGAAYSLGQRRRLSMAAALLRNPRYLFLDEPTIGLDPVAWRSVRAEIERVRDGGGAVVLTGQGFAEIADMVDRVVVLDQGQPRFEGSAAELRALRPPRVRVETADAARLLGEYPGIARSKDGDGDVVEIGCGSLAEAESVAQAIRSSDLPIRALSVERDSLEEAFVALVGSRIEKD